MVKEVNFWCMNPRVAFDKLKSKCHSIILTSGTLSPMDSFSSELDTQFKVVYEGQHVVDVKKQVRIGTVSGYWLILKDLHD